MADLGDIPRYRRRPTLPPPPAPLPQAQPIPQDAPPTGRGTHASLHVPARPQLPALYAILDVATLIRLRLAGPRHLLHLDAAPLADAAAAAAARLVAAGVRLLQVRLTGLDLDAVGSLRVATAVVRAAHAGSADALVIVNDDPALALRCGADGVHLGARDPSPESARAMLGPAAVIGASVRDPALLPVAEADYLGTGPVRATTTKQGLPQPIGVAGLAAVVAAAGDVPVYAIGGLRAADAEQVRAAGAAGMALAGGVLAGLHDPDGPEDVVAAIAAAWAPGRRRAVPDTGRRPGGERSSAATVVVTEPVAVDDGPSSRPVALR
ncbi:MAG: thiamine phosphate synthase [Kineosporiaceae bacterium]